MPPDMQIPSARTTTYSHRKKESHRQYLTSRVASRRGSRVKALTSPSPTHRIPSSRAPPPPVVSIDDARASPARTRIPHDTNHPRARVARARPRASSIIIPPHRTHHVLALQQLLGDDRGQSTEEVTLGVDDDNLRCASMGLVRQSSRSVVSSFASSSASIDPSFRVVGKTPNARDGSRDRSRPSRATSRDARSIVRGERVIFIHLARVLARSSTHLIHDARLRERRTGRRAREVVPVDTVVRVWVETDAGERYCTCYN